MKKLSVLAALLVASIAFAACSDDEDEPRVGEPAEAAFYAYGEPFIEEGIPADEFADGWAVTFDEFVVVVADAAIDGAGEWSNAGTDGVFVDVAKPGDDALNPGHNVGTATLTTSKMYDSASYSIRFPNVEGDALTLNLNADGETVDAMEAEKAAMFVRGAATKGDETYRFEWPLAVSVSYSPCELSEFRPVANQTVPVELSIHGDHLFLDSLSGEEPNLVFEPFAGADANGDFVIDVDELAAVEVDSTILNASAVSGINTVLDYLLFQAATVGHINGEGHCTMVR